MMVGALNERKGLEDQKNTTVKENKLNLSSDEENLHQTDTGESWFSFN